MPTLKAQVLRLLAESSEAAFRRLQQFASVRSDDPLFQPDPENVIGEAILAVVGNPSGFALCGAPHTEDGMIRYLSAIIRNLRRNYARKRRRRKELQAEGVIHHLVIENFRPEELAGCGVARCG